MENKHGKGTKLDEERIAMMKEARQMGLQPEEIRMFLQKKYKSLPIKNNRSADIGFPKHKDI